MGSDFLHILYYPSAQKDHNQPITTINVGSVCVLEPQIKNEHLCIFIFMFYQHGAYGLFRVKRNI